MRDTFKILDALESEGKFHCFQANGPGGFYNLTVTNPDPKIKKNIYIKGFSIKQIEDQLVEAYGHLIGKKKPVAMPLPIPSIPLPLPSIK